MAPLRSSYWLAIFTLIIETRTLAGAFDNNPRRVDRSNDNRFQNLHDISISPPFKYFQNESRKPIVTPCAYQLYKYQLVVIKYSNRTAGYMQYNISIRFTKITFKYEWFKKKKK